MYCTPSETRKAKKQHICTNCGEAVDTGEDYLRWMSVDDGKAFVNKMHPECFDCLVEDKRPNTRHTLEKDHDEPQRQDNEQQDSRFPTRDGIDPKSCMRCRGKTLLAGWENTANGWTYLPKLKTKRERK